MECLLSLGISLAKLRLPLSCVAQVDELSESEVVNIDDAGEKNLKRLEDDAAQLVQLHDVSRRDFARRKREAITDDEKRKAITDYGKALSR